MRYLFFLLFLLFTQKAFAQIDSEQIMINEINLLRCNPKIYKSYVLDYIDRNKLFCKSCEGKKAIAELINLLDTIKPIKKLKFSRGIYLALIDHGGVDTAKGNIKHDMRTLYRINKYDKSFKYVGENIICSTICGQIGDYKKCTDISMRDCIIAFMLDISIPDRGHRLNILDRKFNSVAVRKVSLKEGQITRIFYIQEFGRK